MQANFFADCHCLTNSKAADNNIPNSLIQIQIAWQPYLKQTPAARFHPEHISYPEIKL